MLISLCTPVKNRLDDLRQMLPRTIVAANESPPVEICILDAGSTDGLPEYMDEMVDIARLAPGNTMVYKRIERKYYHQAKAYNMAMLMGKGDYLVTIGADCAPMPGYFQSLRDNIQKGYIWGYVHRTGIIFCKAESFISIGGYDERFEFYGPEDRDMIDRLRACYGREGILPSGLISFITTPDKKKVANYRIRRDKTQFSRMMHKYYQENLDNNVMVVNKGMEWGTWTA